MPLNGTNDENYGYNVNSSSFTSYTENSEMYIQCSSDHEIFNMKGIQLLFDVLIFVIQTTWRHRCFEMDAFT